MRYRDGQYPGAFTVYTKDDKSKELPFFELVKEFKNLKHSGVYLVVIGGLVLQTFQFQMGILTFMLQVNTVISQVVSQW